MGEREGLAGQGCTKAGGRSYLSGQQGAQDVPGYLKWWKQVEPAGGCQGNIAVVGCGMGDIPGLKQWDRGCTGAATVEAGHTYLLVVIRVAVGGNILGAKTMGQCHCSLVANRGRTGAGVQVVGWG